MITLLMRSIVSTINDSPNPTDSSSMDQGALFLPL